MSDEEATSADLEAAFAKIPRMPVVEIDEEAAVKLELLAVERPRSSGGLHKAIIVIGQEGRDDLVAIEADIHTIDAVAAQLETVASRLRELDGSLGRGPEGPDL